MLADAFAAVAPRFNLGIWVTSKQWADAHKPLVTAFANVMAKTAQWSNANHPQSAAILVGRKIIWLDQRRHQRIGRF